jgi:hypothetical protein
MSFVSNPALARAIGAKKRISELRAKLVTTRFNLPQ